MRVGITGTRAGLTEAQEAVVRTTLWSLRHRGGTDLHHGDCVGADEEVALQARTLGYRIVAHPPTSPLLRADFPSDEVRPRRGYLERNRDIVDEVDVLIACPATADEQLRSGTWATVRYARSVDRARFVIEPDGRYAEVSGLPLAPDAG